MEPAQPPESSSTAAAAATAADPPQGGVSAADAPMGPESGGLWIEELETQRDVAMGMASQLAKDLEAKKTLLEGRLENATRLCAEAEARLAKANREYQSKHLTLRKRMLSVVATLATASFLGWLACALLTQRFPLGAVLILPASLIVAIPLFRRSGEEGGLLELAWS